MKDTVKHSVGKLFDQVDIKVTQLEARMQAALEPTRKSVLQRFPILFTLLTTFGLVTTFLGFELVLAQIGFLYSRPWLMLSVGVLVLVLTGSLYKKLG
jgi:hypothetical protein